MDNIKFFKEAKYGLMIHFGLYSLLGGTYNNKNLMDTLNGLSLIRKLKWTKLINSLKFLIRFILIVIIFANSLKNVE